MVDFVKELVSCRNKSTQLPFFPDKVKGYTENELNLIAKKCNLDIHGQFKDFLLQMGKCSGGLLWDDEFYMYDNKWSSSRFVRSQLSEKEDLGYMLANHSKIDPVEKKLFYLTHENETYFYYILTAERDDYIWSLHDADEEGLVKENYTLLEYLKHHVEQKTKQTQFINFNFKMEAIDRHITGRLL
ncbi:SMI1/KNR4 family protein [Acinetobacter soli]|uniref:SMI1/KNR4 family protein n=2 Tax=Acinetobacter soli TaxID=487316 RepID=UPI00124FD44F|nr:SMI1/KNR4 family protein [Acinetobacter soli]